MQYIPSLSEEIQNIISEASSQAAQAEANTKELHAALSAKDEEALHKYEMLLGELQKAFKESEGYFEQWKKTESLLSPFSLECEKIHRGPQRNTGTHRSWDFTFHQVKLLGRQWAQVDLRLVEHNGNAGIVIFEGQNPPQPLYHWEPNGEEGGRHFVLCVPADQSARDRIVGLPASDLVFLRESACSIIQDIAVHGLPGGPQPPWLQIAKRLLQHFNEIPNRIHYDSVKTSIMPEQKGQPVLRFELVNAYFQGQLCKMLPVVWETSESKILIESSTGNEWPLLAWPSTESGQPAAEVIFDLGADPLARKTWSNWLKQDQQLVSFLIKEIPNFLHHFFEQHPESPIPKDTLQKQARKMSRTLKHIAAGKKPGFFQK